MYAPSGLLRGESQRGVAERHALPLCPLSSCLTTASPPPPPVAFCVPHWRAGTAPFRGQPRAAYRKKEGPEEFDEEVRPQDG